VPEAGQVVVVHGLWMTGAEATLFRHRLAARGYAVRQYHYHSGSATAATVLAGLRDEVLGLGGPVHLVGHSLGGLVIMRLLEAYPELPVARVVLLGAPVNGSRAAAGLVRLTGSDWMFGPMASDELLAATPRVWQHAAPVGVVAGTQSLGLGRFICGLDGPNDGTVAVAETRLAGASGHLELGVSHVGFMLSQGVVEATATFLATGSFSA
jgi:pimeloyl-ACP methyl ester carboxylesterase